MLSTQDTLSDVKKPFILFRPFVAVWRWMFPPTLADMDRQSYTSRIIAGAAIVLFSLTLMGVTLYNGRTWHRMLKTWQSNRMVERSEKMEKSEKLLEAVMEANNAYVKDPDNPKAVRALARYATLMKRNEARFLWDRLQDLSGPLSDDDLEGKIQSLMNLNEDKTAANEIEKTLRESKPTKKIVEMADRVMRKLGRQEDLLTLLKTYVKQQPDDQQIRLTLAVRLLELGTKDDAPEAMATLWELTALQDDVGMQAIDYLNRLDITGTDDQRKLIELLNHHPKATQEHHVAALRRLTILEPQRKQEIIDEAIKERANAKREDLVPLTRWLTLEGENEKILSFLKEEMAQNYAPLLQNYLNALTGLKRYDQLERVLRDVKTRLTPAERSFHLVHLAFVTNKGWDDVNRQLIDAIKAAQSEAKPDMIMQLAKYAEDRNHLLVAEQAYRAATSSRRKEQSAYDGLLRLTYKNGNSKGFMETAQETARRWPDNQFFLEQSIYSCLLAGINVETSIVHAQKLLDARPEDSQRKLIMALAYIRQLDAKAAAAQLQHIRLNELSLGQAAVMCGVMQEAGYGSQALKIAQQIPSDRALLPEENRFLQMTLLADPPLGSGL